LNIDCVKNAKRFVIISLPNSYLDYSLSDYLNQDTIQKLLGKKKGIHETVQNKNATYIIIMFVVAALITITTTTTISFSPVIC
jgi:hypothetical protein